MLCCRFGKIFASHLFGTPTVVSAEPELNRFLFKNDTRFFEPGWPRSFGDLVGKQSISYLVGDAHKHMRSIILDFLSAERTRTLFLGDMDRLASLLIGSWKEGSVVSSLDEATKVMNYWCLHACLASAKVVFFVVSFHFTSWRRTFWASDQKTLRLRGSVKSMMRSREGLFHFLWKFQEQFTARLCR